VPSLRFLSRIGSLTSNSHGYSPAMDPSSVAEAASEKYSRTGPCTAHDRRHTGKWHRELDYRLIKEIWGRRANRIAVRFAYEWHDDSGLWYRSYGNENWEFDEHGLMRVRLASINDALIRESERKYHWPLGRRPDDHPSLSELGF
jgi:nuclear transport factor 2 (NTF2) superfamily protein